MFYLILLVCTYSTYIDSVLRFLPTQSLARGTASKLTSFWAVDYLAHMLKQDVYSKCGMYRHYSSGMQLLNLIACAVYIINAL